MESRLLDLSTEERARAFRRDYFFRLATVVALVATVLLVVHGVLLLPAYFDLMQAKGNAENRVATVNERLASSGDREIIERLAVLGTQTDHLAKLGATPSASTVIKSILALPRSGISIYGFSFSPASGKTPGQLRITGMSASRDALRSYQSILATLPTVSGVDLPISAYAKESEIPFMLTISGTFTP